MKDEGNHQGAVDKSFSEQRIRIVDANYILCEKNWTCTHSGTRSYGRQMAGRWQSDEIQVHLEIFKNHCTLKDSKVFILKVFLHEIGCRGIHWVLIIL